MSFSSNNPRPMKTRSPKAGEPNNGRHKYVRGRWKPRNKVDRMEHTMRSLCVEVPLTKGEEVRRELQEAGLLRKELRIERAANVLYIPVNAPPGPHYRTLKREFRQCFPSVRSYRGSAPTRASAPGHASRSPSMRSTRTQLRCSYSERTSGGTARRPSRSTRGTVRRSCRVSGRSTA